MPVERHHNFIRTLILFIGFLIFTAVFGTLLCGMWYGQLTLQSIQTKGLQTDALLQNKYRDDANRFWLTYRFTTLTDDTYVSSIDVAEAHYQAYEIGDLLSMHYLAHNPEFNALDILSEDIRANALPMIGLSLFVMILAVILAIAGMRDIPYERLSTLWQQFRDARDRLYSP